MINKTSNWRAVWVSEDKIQLFIGAVLVASVIRVNSYQSGELKTGWRVNPFQTSRRPSRKLWESAADAVRSKHGTEAARAVDEAFNQKDSQ